MAKDRNEKVTREIINWVENSMVFYRLFCSAPVDPPCLEPAITMLTMIAGEELIAVGGYCMKHLDHAATACLAQRGFTETHPRSKEKAHG